MVRFRLSLLLLGSAIECLFGLAGNAVAQVNVVPPNRLRQEAVADAVASFRDIPYVTNGHERQMLDLYLPKDAQGALPVIIWVHGGAWLNGSKDNCPPLHAGFVNRGYAVASINYRLSHHATFPAQIEDCKAAVRWLRAHASEYHLDPNRFGAWGSSAGGHLVALLGTSGDVKNFDVGENLNQSSRVQAVCDYYGPSDLVAFVNAPGYQAHASPDSPESKLLGGLVKENPERAAQASPVTFVTADDPPFLIVHGDKDSTVAWNQSQLLSEALKQAGCSVHFHTIRDAGHGGPGFNDPEIANMVQAFFDETLKSATASRAKFVTTESSVDPHAAGGRPAAPRGGGMPAELILQREDKNSDGKISREEFRGRPQVFDNWDTNKDGLLSLDELRQGLMSLQSPQR